MNFRFVIWIKIQIWPQLNKNASLTYSIPPIHQNYLQSHLKANSSVLKIDLICLKTLKILQENNFYYWHFFIQLIFELLYFLQMYQILVGSVDNFDKSYEKNEASFLICCQNCTFLWMANMKFKSWMYSNGYLMRGSLSYSLFTDCWLLCAKINKNIINCSWVPNNAYSACFFP